MLGNRLRLRLQPLDARDLPSVVPVGPEFVISAVANATAQRQSVALDGDGDFVVAWQAVGVDGSSNAVVARRFLRDGTPQGNQFQVNTYATGSQESPVVACDAAGNFIVAWGSASVQDGSRAGVYFRRFAANGAPLTSEVAVNTTTLNIQDAPSIAMDSNGDFVIAWESNYQDNDGYSVVARRFSATGAPLTGEVAVNGTTTGDQRAPAVACDASGNFVVAWESPEGLDVGICARRFSASGSALGAEWVVNAQTNDEQSHPAVARDLAGNFIVAWQRSNQDGSGLGVYARRYDSAGQVQGTEFRVNTGTVGDQSLPKIAADASGQFIVAWQTPDQDGAGIAAQRVSASGQLVGSAFAVNFTTLGEQTAPAIGMDSAGEFVIAWRSDDQASVDIRAQRYYKPPGPRATAVIDDGTSQRSGVRSVTLTFNTLVTINPGGITLAGPGGATTVAWDSSASAYNHTVARLTFSGAGTTAAGLIDGNYVLTLHSAGVLNYEGEGYDGDGNGSPGPDGAFTFFRLYGDMDGNRVVDLSDYLVLRAGYGLTSSSPSFPSSLDYNGDGVIDLTDFLAFRGRYGFYLPT